MCIRDSALQYYFLVHLYDSIRELILSPKVLRQRSALEQIKSTVQECVGCHDYVDTLHQGACEALDSITPPTKRIKCDTSLLDRVDNFCHEERLLGKLATLWTTSHMKMSPITHIAKKMILYGEYHQKKEEFF